MGGASSIEGRGLVKSTSQKLIGVALDVSMVQLPDMQRDETLKPTFLFNELVHACVREEEPF